MCDVRSGRDLFLIALGWGLLAVAGASGDEWPHYARDAARSSVTARATRDLATIHWSVTPNADEEYVWRSSPVVYGGRVFVNARGYTDPDPNHVENRVIAYDVYDGTRLWTQPIEPDIYDSWASPAVDMWNETVILGCGQTVYAIDTASGDIAWQTPLDLHIVNSSPNVTNDLSESGTPANRVFITDYDDSGSESKLYAINVDAYQPTHNPYQPGDIVWSVPLGSITAATPAYDNGVVYLAGDNGAVRAVDAVTGVEAWATDVGDEGYADYESFFAGVTVCAGYVYAASYGFYGTGNNSGLFKLDATSGNIVWVAPCERTESIPIVVGDRIYLAAGLDGFGSAIKLQAFQDHGAWVAELWDTYVDTGGQLIVGGWTHQPVYSRGFLYAGTPQEEGWEFYLPCTDLYVLDTSKTPSDPDFIVAHHAGSGGSPAVADGTVYSFGEDGLFAFEPSPPCLADLDANGVVDLSDLAELLGAYGSTRGDASFDSDADLDRSGSVNLDDLADLLGTYGEACP